MGHKKIKNQTGQRLSAAELKEAIAQLLLNNPGKRYAPAQVKDLLRISNNKDSIKYALDLATDVVATQLSKTPTSILKEKPTRTFGGRNVSTYTGTVDMTRTGAAYIQVPELSEDVYVPGRLLNTAMNRDLVRVRVIQRAGARSEGVVEEVIERNQTNFIGTLRVFDHHAQVFPDIKMIPFDLEVALDKLMGAEDGDKVIVKVVEWPETEYISPKAEVVALLGQVGGHEYEANVVLINNGFNIAFPLEANRESEAIPDQIPEAEIAKRRDFRGITTFTIDPEDAKDFDDAISIRRLDNMNYEIGVHIADVSHYVQPNTALDKEAYLRSTSVYLVGRVCPMLPERISNNLCSLRPNEDKLCYSAVFEIDNEGHLVDRWFGRTVIHSDRRFSYEEAQEIIEGKEGDFEDEIRILNTLALKLRTKRFKEGSINFDETEIRFKLDEKGEPVEVFAKDRKEAHLLIEDYMLLANREVARYMAKLDSDTHAQPFVYRVHDLPDVGKLTELGRAAAELGLKLDFQVPKNIAASLNILVDSARTNPALAMLAPLAIRCMAKAAYTTHNIGHYGLGFEYYTHFTSPIRRYADVLSHRILSTVLEKDNAKIDLESIESQCRHISVMEKKAAESEREYTKYMQAVYMDKMVGETMEGKVSGFIERGFFVEVGDARAEGMIPFEKLKDTFQVSDNKLKAKGIRKGLVIMLGQKIEVRILAVDPEKRQIEMSVVSWPDNPNAPTTESNAGSGQKLRPFGLASLGNKSASPRSGGGRQAGPAKRPGKGFKR